jgi:two-component system, chemotaxis family, chemotaxis protein CheY
MKIIRDSAEHHFLTKLDELKKQPQGWMVLSCSLSGFLSHTDIISSLSEIPQKLEAAKKRADVFADDLARKSIAFEDVLIYVFADTDVVLLARTSGQEKEQAFAALHRDVSAKLPAKSADIAVLSHEFSVYQKLADRKFLSAKRFEAYRAMSDANKVSSIAVRRERHENPRVLIIEDDRFTAVYASNILAKDYDLTVCRTGEEGLAAYIEQAPDIVFLDVHMPGLSGHDTLAGIKAVDSKAFVVMLSADTMKTNIVQAAEGGANNFLKKPFSKERLINTVKNSPYVRGFPLENPGDENSEETSIH